MGWWPGFSSPVRATGSFSRATYNEKEEKHVRQHEGNGQDVRQ